MDNDNKPVKRKQTTKASAAPLAQKVAKNTTRKTTKARMPSWQRTPPQLEAKLQPAQHRAAATYELILSAAADTLTDVGVERLSTNLVCKRAGLSPPALYRYFPNKYALLSELGQRLMQVQNDCVGEWITPEVLAAGSEELEAALSGLLIATFEVTQATPAGVWLMRALRAVPPLQQVRIDSHRRITAQQATLLKQTMPDVDPQLIELICRIVVDLIYSTIEMVFDEQMDPCLAAPIVAGMMASPLEKLRPQRKKR